MAGRFRTSRDLVLEALANIGVLSTGQPLDPEDFDYVNEKLDAIFRMISGLEICTIGEPDAIPGELFAPLADIVAGECATKFGVTPDVWATLKNAGLGGAPGQGGGPPVDIGNGAAAKTIRAILRLKPTLQVVPSEFF